MPRFTTMRWCYLRAARLMSASASPSHSTKSALLPSLMRPWSARRIRSAALAVEKQNPAKSVEVIDLRTLNPYDWQAIRASVEKTSRVIVAHEDTLSFGYGAEIAARIADELFGDLDAPVRRVAATDTFCAYHPSLEDAILPQTADIVRAVKDLAAY